MTTKQTTLTKDSRVSIGLIIAVVGFGLAAGGVIVKQQTALTSIEVQINGINEKISDVKIDVRELRTEVRDSLKK